MSSSSRLVRRARVSTREANSSRPLAPGRASSTRRAPSFTTSRPQSWIFETPACTTEKLRKVGERFGKRRAATVAPPRPYGGAMTRTFKCERDGVVIRGADDDELTANVARHVAQAHPDLVGKLSRGDVLTLADEA